MSEFPARSCNRCGAREGMMAQVSDPFMDACYGLCRSCLYMPFREREVVEQPHDERDEEPHNDAAACSCWVHDGERDPECYYHGQARPATQEPDEGRYVCSWCKEPADPARPHSHRGAMGGGATYEPVEWVPDERTVRAVIDALLEDVAKYDDDDSAARIVRRLAGWIAERFGITDKEGGR